MEAAETGNLDAVKKHCALPDISTRINEEKDNFKRTALHKAAHSGYYEIMEELLKVEGIDVNVQDKRGFTPLYLAACGREKPYGAVVLLCEVNADPLIASFPDDDGKTLNAIDGAVGEELKKYLRDFRRTKFDLMTTLSVITRVPSSKLHPISYKLQENQSIAPCDALFRFF